ncbi:class I SAM-dependent methyltransferase [Vulgatibacter incomptus]|uniref:SAM-dependent methyltransferase n=1 Tax=Vulgatibacter incomptus TaxID=1391653 RepID=A0A0K1PCF9_9BACT|nr:class I SAM-dependent methyltransferase [Vulgatibacter incomptus]AKU90799.1 SAM-dependent methyltransferase [Vulgatibacter incomptus]
MQPSSDLDQLRRSWNAATRNHNAHKGDQISFLRSGGDVLFPEEVELLGDLRGKRLVHLQCNAGQDTLCLARRGAEVVGVDLSDEAIGFARSLAAGSEIPARFEEAEVVSWLEGTNERFDLAFSSYGATPWLPDLDAWARGVRRVLRPGGRFVYVEFHPSVWSFGADLRLSGDDYFLRGPFVDPVGDYVAASGDGLGAVTVGPTVPNDVPAKSWQRGLGEIVQSLIDAGLLLETVREFPHANGCKVIGGLVPGEGRRWLWPDGTARLPLMFGLSARAP